ncbi:MAG: SUMF1/EgtB/PvdO family nonheme iron enzyme [bacterium]
MSSGEDDGATVDKAVKWSDETMDAASTLGPARVPAVDVELEFVHRYRDLGLIGRGGMGEVRRVFDRVLDRTVAMKILGTTLLDNAVARQRFMMEAGITAGLQHPGIVPVHDRGELPDGRLWYTMREVHGRTLARVIHGVHAANNDGNWRASDDGWTLRRLVEALLRVTEAMAYAHRQGIIHRDLKPQNIMVGAFGEVQVMDWGLATRIDRAPDHDLPFDGPDEGEAEPAPLSGQIVGTPAYMPPEQAMGVEPLSRAADVYALGGVLYQILTGVPPFVGTAQSVWRNTVEGPPPAVRERVHVDHPPLPDELVSICDRAMSREPEDRHADGTALARDLRSWLEGARRREEAEAIVQSAVELLPRARDLRQRALRLREAAEVELSALASYDPPERRYDAWAVQDEAAALERQAALVEVEWEQQIRSALTQFADLTSAHRLLADFYRERLETAEAARRREDVARFEALLRIHDRGAHVAFLRGDGRLTLATDPPGARAQLYRLVEVHRRLEPRFERELGVTPLDAVPLPRGSYLVRLTAEGREPVDYPVFIERSGHWDGVRPGEKAPHPIRLPRAGELDRDDVYVPAGWFWSGGDAEAIEALPRRRVWVDGFVIRRFSTTQREYLAFVNDLAARGREDEALAVAPLRLAAEGKSVQYYARTANGEFTLSDEPADQSLDDPIYQVSWFAAVAYTQWLAERAGAAWRLPDELEREKATRGVDGRFYPWGDTADAPWACALDTLGDQSPRWQPIHTFPDDVSPYGVRGLAGNTRDWCVNIWRREGPRIDDGRLVVEPAPTDDQESYRAIRGGAWMANLLAARAAARFANRPHQRFSVLGIRPVRPFDVTDS